MAPDGSSPAVFVEKAMSAKGMAFCIFSFDIDVCPIYSAVMVSKIGVFTLHVHHLFLKEDLNSARTRTRCTLRLADRKEGNAPRRNPKKIENS